MAGLPTTTTTTSGKRLPARLAGGGGLLLVCGAFLLLSVPEETGGWGPHLRFLGGGGGHGLLRSMHGVAASASLRHDGHGHGSATAQSLFVDPLPPSTLGCCCPEGDNAYEQLKQLWRLSDSVYAEERWQQSSGATAADKRARGRGKGKGSQPQPAAAAAVFPAAEEEGPVNSTNPYAGRVGPTRNITDYSFRVITIRNDSETLTLSIKETRWDGEGDQRKEVATLGGASFHVDWEVFGGIEKGIDEELVKRDSKGALQGRVLSVVACASTDHFNGSYTVCCRPPLNAGKGMSRLTVQVYFLDYKAFQHAPLGPPLLAPVYEAKWDTAIVEQALAEQEQALQSQTEVQLVIEADGSGLDGDESEAAQAAPPLPPPPPSMPDCHDSMLQLASTGEWADVDGKLRWVDPIRRCVTPISEAKDIIRCVDEEYDSITFLGDSHVRQVSEYFGAFLSNMTSVHDKGWGHQDTVMTPKLRFLWNTDGAELAKRIKQDLLNGTTGKRTARDIIVMDTGHWDLMGKDVSHFVRQALPAVVTALEELRANPATKDYRLVWVTTYPMPPQSDGGFRSEATAQAGDTYLGPHLHRLGMEVLPVLPVIRPRALHSIDDHHWFNDFSAEGPGQYHGDVGVEIARMLTRYICPKR